jgi:tRNA-dihydrouridine synthase B
VAIEAALIAENSGANAIALHPRTQKAGFSGKADWGLIAQVKSKIKIPVIGSGDIFSPLDVKDIIEKTNCDFVMVGRGSLGNPWIFSRSNHFLETGELLPEPTFAEKINICLKHTQLVVKEKGEKLGIKEMRKYMVWYTKGLPNSAELRKQIFHLETYSQVEKVLWDFPHLNSSLVQV